MNEAALIALVHKAISLHKTTGCFEYFNDELQTRLQRELAHVATLKGLKELLVQHSAGGGDITFRREIRPEYQDRREFWFRAWVQVTGFSVPLFYELELIDEDVDCPSVAILNIHFQVR